jgi:hypothetical protein
MILHHNASLGQMPHKRLVDRERRSFREGALPADRGARTRHDSVDRGTRSRLCRRSQTSDRGRGSYVGSNRDPLRSLRADVHRLGWGSRPGGREPSSRRHGRPGASQYPDRARVSDPRRRSDRGCEDPRRRLPGPLGRRLPRLLRFTWFLGLLRLSRLGGRDGLRLHRRDRSHGQGIPYPGVFLGSCP